MTEATFVGAYDVFTGFLDVDKDPPYVRRGTTENVRGLYQAALWVNVLIWVKFVFLSII